MNSKTCSAGNRLQVLVLILMLGAFSCTPRMIKPTPAPKPKPRVERSVPASPAIPLPKPVSPAPPEKAQPPVAAEPSPRMLASLQLTQQGEALVKRGQADSAIRTLERAVSLDPSNGRNYYYLAEAWLLKDDPEQAANYNGLAAIHLGADPAWQQRIAEQKWRIGRPVR